MLATLVLDNLQYTVLFPIPLDDNVHQNIETLPE